MRNMINKIFILFLLLFIFTYNIYADETTEKTTEEIVEETKDNNENDNIYINPNTGYKCIIEDDASLIGENSINSLREKMIELTEYGNIMFKTTNVNSSTATYYAQNYYHKTFGTASGSLFLIDMENRQIYIFSDGANYNIITSSKAYSITDNVYRYAKNEQYYNCAYETFDQMLTLLKGNKINEPMRYISNVLISITCAAFLNYFFVVSKSKIRKASAKEIIKFSKSSVQIGNVNAYKSGTTKEYRPVSDSSSSGGGSSGGGGGGGGGSSGGGGGHGF